MNPATTPTRALSGSPRAQRVADQRWQEWRPLWEIWVRSIYPSESPAMWENLASMRHADILQSLFARGIPMRQIRRLALDDPREPLSVLEAKAQRYTQRRLKRSNHVAH